MAEFPPVAMSMIVASLARIVLLERGLGITRGHAEAEARIERYLDRFETPSPRNDGPLVTPVALAAR